MSERGLGIQLEATVPILGGLSRMTQVQVGLRCAIECVGIVGETAVQAGQPLAGLPPSAPGRFDGTGASMSGVCCWKGQARVARATSPLAPVSDGGSRSAAGCESRQHNRATTTASVTIPNTIPRPLDLRDAAMVHPCTSCLGSGDSADVCASLALRNNPAHDVWDCLARAGWIPPTFVLHMPPRPRT